MPVAVRLLALIETIASEFGRLLQGSRSPANVAVASVVIMADIKWLDAVTVVDKIHPVQQCNFRAKLISCQPNR